MVMFNIDIYLVGYAIGIWRHIPGDNKHFQGRNITNLSDDTFQFLKLWTFN